MGTIQHLQSDHARNLEDLQRTQIVCESFERRRRLLTAEPFGIRVMNVKLWTKNILHSHFFHEGEVVVLACVETQAGWLFLQSDKERIALPVHMLVKQISEPPAGAELWIPAPDLPEAGNARFPHLRTKNGI